MLWSQLSSNLEKPVALILKLALPASSDYLRTDVFPPNAIAFFFP